LGGSSGIDDRFKVFKSNAAVVASTCFSLSVGFEVGSWDRGVDERLETDESFDQSLEDEEDVEDIDPLEKLAWIISHITKVLYPIAAADSFSWNGDWTTRGGVLNRCLGLRFELRG
jgi:hypothetical protein